MGKSVLGFLTVLAVILCCFTIVNALKTSPNTPTGCAVAMEQDIFAGTTRPDDYRYAKCSHLSQAQETIAAQDVVEWEFTR